MTSTGWSAFSNWQKLFYPRNLTLSEPRWKGSTNLGCTHSKTHLALKKQSNEKGIWRTSWRPSTKDSSKKPRDLSSLIPSTNNQSLSWIRKDSIRSKSHRFSISALKERMFKCQRFWVQDRSPPFKSKVKSLSNLNRWCLWWYKSSQRSTSCLIRLSVIWRKLKSLSHRKLKKRRNLPRGQSNWT
jgi:hypothetical protein